MHLLFRFPVPVGSLRAAATVVLALLVLLTGQAVAPTPDPKAPPAAAPAPQPSREDRAGRPAADTFVSTPAPAPPAARSVWSGFAFDACRAPSQRVMDTWRVSSPFTGVGIYLGGIHRACEQRYLTPGWVGRQLDHGWHLLPIWVGPQASCTGYNHRISGKPGKGREYDTARTRGVREARAAAARARALGVPAREALFYDLEPFDTDLPHCRRSSLALLEEWTKELHRQGYRSGVYSHVKAGIALLSRTGRSYTRPDAVWYAWVDRVGSLPRKSLAASFMRTSRIHQYALDRRVEFGGVRMDIDWNYVSLGSLAPAVAPASCDQVAARTRPRRLQSGSSGALVRLAQCLVLPGDRHPTKTSGRYDAATVHAVHRFQKRHGLTPTGSMNRRTWVALLARGSNPVLRKGSRGEAVERLQRALNAALKHGEIRVDGSYGKATVRAVKRYRRHVGLEVKPVVTARMWKALERGRGQGTS